MNDEIPKFVLEKRPEMVQVFEALKQFLEGKEITVECKSCENPLTIYQDDALGFLNVNCTCGKSNYRSKWDPKKA